MYNYSMDFELGCKLFKALYGNIDGYYISSKARSTIPHPDKAFTYGEVVPESFYEMIKKRNWKSNRVLL